MDTPMAMPIADTRRAGAIDSGGMRAGGNTPAKRRLPLPCDGDFAVAGRSGFGFAGVPRAGGTMPPRSVRTADSFGWAMGWGKGVACGLAQPDSSAVMPSS